METSKDTKGKQEGSQPDNLGYKLGDKLKGKLGDKLGDKLKGKLGDKLGDKGDKASGRHTIQQRGNKKGHKGRQDLGKA